MGKISDLDAFDRRQIVGTRCMDHSISEIVRELGFSRSTVYREYMDGGEKTSDQANCKGQLALNACGARQLSHIVRSRKLVESMPRRVAAVIKARGGPTRQLAIPNSVELQCILLFFPFYTPPCGNKQSA
ncbi:hypothetical protein AVEN_12698-1 [Araneus ventricosus]|uniref:Tc3 transposase DNA binding domain-containing protein n=1 Tax=Araneus ventricosus TaxID=182803 RepID=A0A4Y2ABA6_ARAVE|nr:hypothetical protein AVEN_12698-1 [Araneus ventricosus]